MRCAALGSGIQARAGVLTGEAAVTIGATNQGMVAGDIVNTASRLQTAAAPGTVLVGEATAAGRLGRDRVRGRRRSRRSRARRRRSRPGAPSGWSPSAAARNRSDALEAPFVGRDEELRQLKDLFQATSRGAPAPPGERDRAGRDREDPPRLGVPQVPRRPARARLVARRPEPGLRRRDHVLGAGRDGPRPGGPRGDRRRGDDAGTDRGDASRATSPETAEAAWIEPALLALLGVGRPIGLGPAVRRLADVLRAARRDRPGGHGLRGPAPRGPGPPGLHRPPDGVEPRTSRSWS